MAHHVVTIIGAGNLGKAIAHAFGTRKDVAVRLWDVDSSQVPGGPLPLAEALADADAVFLCIPSWTFVGALHHLSGFLAKHSVVVSLSKGIEPDGSRFMYEVLEQDLPPHQPWAVMSGPMLAAEIVADKPSFGVIASLQHEAALHVASLFRGTSVVTEVSGDVVGVSYMGVLKNIYSLGLGMTEALGWAGNARGWYVAMAQRECAGIITAMGGSAESAFGPAGLGDLVATGFSQHSRNRGHGEALVLGLPYPQGSEGLASLPQLLARIGNTLNDRPLLRAIKLSVDAPADAARAFGAVFKG